MAVLRLQMTTLALAGFVCVFSIAGCGGDSGSSSATTDPAVAAGAVTGAASGSGADPVSGAVPRAVAGPALTGCGSFHEGRYFIVNPKQQNDLRTAQVDAAAMTMTQANVSAPQLGLNTPCDYSYANGTARVTVSQSGVALIRYAGASANIDLAIPEQTLSVAELVGGWNVMTYNEAVAGAGRSVRQGKMTVSADGTVSSIDCGSGHGACAAAVADGKIDLNPAGGFLLNDGSGGTGKPLFGLRAADGQVMMVISDSSGVRFAINERAQAVPVGGAIVRAWELQINSGGAVSALTQGDYLVSAVIPAAQIFERFRLVDGQNDSLVLNVPRDGMMRRSAGSSVLTGDTVATPYPELLLMPMDNFGLTVYGALTATPGDSFLGFLINQPGSP